MAACGIKADDRRNDIVRDRLFAPGRSGGTAGEFDGFALTNMDAQLIPVGSGIHTTGLLVGD